MTNRVQTSPETSPAPSPAPRPQARRRRHLLDPDNPRPAPRSQGMTLTNVQRWVASALAVTTIWHLALGLVVAAWYVDASRPVDQAGLLVIAGLFGIVGVAFGLLIHRRSVLSPWLLVGVVPAVGGALWLF